MSDDDDEDGFEKGCALIRSNLGVNPTEGSFEDWAYNYVQALWLERFRNRNLAEILSRLFGETKSQP